MKKLLFTAAIAVLGFTSVNAQEDTTVGGFANGDVFISGAVGFGSTTQGDSKDNQFEISPKVGFFVSDNIAVGVSLGFESFKNENSGINPVTFEEATIESKRTSLSAGVFGRYYATPASQFSFFGELAAKFVASKNEQDFVEEDQKFDGLDFEFAPGISYFVSDSITLEASIGVLGYNTFKADVDGAEARNQFNIGLDLSDINFGIAYKF
ncbi:outer membrane beta-barrel protein [Lacinutrix mariniflava]|uniref:outer membrane beta-barrel protein n=1 Tax=Lacinutrix mariniflava TaxID=342955 RepID=UPI0006E2A1C6|nr:outer membrane beta-barrel protein [Lacinutrix mariniflava]